MSAATMLLVHCAQIYDTVHHFKARAGYQQTCSSIAVWGDKTGEASPCKLDGQVARARESRPA